MKILFWRTDYYGALTGGGIASLYNGLIEGFRKLGHECAFVSSGKRMINDSINYYYIPYPKLFRNLPEILCLPYNERSIKRVKEIIEIEKPDFIYQHNHDFSYSGSIIKKELGIPFFMHSDGVEYWIKKNWGKLYFGHLLKWAEEIQWETSDAIFCISENVKKQMVKLNVNSDKIYVNPNGVNTDTFHPEIDGSNIHGELNLEDKFVLGYSGTFGHWHGVDYLAKSMKHILQEIPHAYLLLVGDGILRPEIDKIIEEDNIGENTLITGMVPYDSVPKYLAACDVLLTPCVHNVGLDFFNSPIKLFEYMAMGKPVVATDVGQQGDVINNEMNGILCQEKSPQQIADAVVEIYNNPDLAQKISGQARKDAVEKHDWKQVAQNIIDVYNTLFT